MADLSDIQDQIRSLEGRPKNVEEKEITKILDELRDRHGYNSGWRNTGHGKICWIQGETFSICTHHRGGKQLKPCYVKAFIKATIEVGVYEKD
jgi:hypothetical protein